MQTRCARRSETTRSQGLTALPDLLPWLIGVAAVVLLVLVLCWQKQDPWPMRRKEPPIMLMYCAWCIHRDGEDCTSEGSPVYQQSCGPVYMGAQQCEAREARR